MGMSVLSWVWSQGVAVSDIYIYMSQRTTFFCLCTKSHYIISFVGFLLQLCKYPDYWFLKMNYVIIDYIQMYDSTWCVYQWELIQILPYLEVDGQILPFLEVDACWTKNSLFGSWCMLDKNFLIWNLMHAGQILPYLDILEFVVNRQYTFDWFYKLCNGRYYILNFSLKFSFRWPHCWL